MLSEYFIYLFMVYEIIILVAAYLFCGKHRHLILWLPTAVIVLILLTQPVVQYVIQSTMDRDPFDPLYLYLHLIIKQWNKRIYLNLVVCFLFSLEAWLICPFPDKKNITKERVLKVLTLVFAVFSAFTAIARYYNLPYRFNENSSSLSLWVEEANGIQYYRFNYAITYEIYGNNGTVNTDLLIYELPDTSSEVIAVIPAGEECYLGRLDFSHPTLEHNWRYAIISSGDNFPDQKGVRGYIMLSDALKSFATGQKSWLHNCFARINLLMEDDVAYYQYSHVTPDYYQYYLPFGVYMSLILFLISLFGYLV